MRGEGVLLLWNDIDPEVDVEYNRWHSREHVPERVTVPGILAGRRYVRADDAGDPKYLSIYELTSTAVLSSAPYLKLVDQPTPWSKKMRPHFSNIRRIACKRPRSLGAGVGAWAQVIDLDASVDASNNDTGSILENCNANDGLIAAHWCEIDASVPGLAWNSDGDEKIATAAILLLEATDQSSLLKARINISQLRGGNTPARWGATYVLHHILYQEQSA